jgi:capsular exopolysaccharide synthesis family protein
MKDINDQLTDIRGSILESLQNLNKNLTFQERSLEQQNSHYRQFLSSLPRKERAMQEIKRKQGITEGLYLYLLQKREEAAISSTSGSISNYKQIEPAKGSGPVSPIEIYILMYTTLLGLCLPIAIVYLRDLFNDKVVTRSDITRKLQAPILGDVNHIPSEKRKGISVVGRDIISEQFRIIRTNLSILLAKKDKVIILVTSSAAGEGKSTISTNLAAVMSLAGKKVALLEFDLRKPVISDLLKVQSSKGLSDYLSGATSNIQDISTTLPGFPSLHVFPAGEIYSNPSDLLLNTKLEDLFSQLQKTYDYVIIDSAPTALVSDAFILAQYSDAVLYIIRQRKTLKKQMDFINEVTVSKRMKNISLIFNDVKTGGRFGYYGYGDTNGRGYESNGVKFKGRQEKTKALSQEV